MIDSLVSFAASTVTAVTVATFAAALLTILFIRQLTQQPTQPPTEKPTIRKLALRVDDIPVDKGDDLNRDLQEIIENDAVLRDAVAAPARRSLVRKGMRSLCATITVGTSLSPDYLVSRLHQAGANYPYNYTCKFEGITPLHDGFHGADVDIIAVPGLGSHPLGSWKAPNGDDVWLRDFLPEDIPNVRILLYGYDTMMPGSLSKQSIEDLGGALLEQIIAFRERDKTSCRPIVFIGHSLGGLLIKEALVRAYRKSHDANFRFFQACYGLLFFGVPNLGLRNDHLMTLVRGQPNESLVRDLLVDNDSEPSDFLKRLADDFSEICRGHCRVVTFSERMLSPTIELSQNGQWQKTGPHSLLVTKKSATSTGLVAMAEEDDISLNTDHSGLIKVQSRSHNYYDVIERRIDRLVEETKAEVNSRDFAKRNDGQMNRKRRQSRSSQVIRIQDMIAGHRGHQLVAMEGDKSFHVKNFEVGNDGLQFFGSSDVGMLAQLIKARKNAETEEVEEVAPSASRMKTN
ncbi:hypothetical protein EsH8_IV_000059 [Colletotrichum jinshuiense]